MCFSSRRLHRRAHLPCPTTSNADYPQYYLCICSWLLVTHLRLDDEMYEDFQASFPEFSEATDPKSVLKIDEEAMKSPAGKEKWRVFINKYENKGKLHVWARARKAYKACQGCSYCIHHQPAHWGIR